MGKKLGKLQNTGSIISIHTSLNTKSFYCYVSRSTKLLHVHVTNLHVLALCGPEFGLILLAGMTQKPLDLSYFGP